MLSLSLCIPPPLSLSLSLSLGNGRRGEGWAGPLPPLVDTLGEWGGEEEWTGPRKAQRRVNWFNRSLSWTRRRGCPQGRRG